MPGYVLGNFFYLFCYQCFYAGTGKYTGVKYGNELWVQKRETALLGDICRILCCAGDMCYFRVWSKHFFTGCAWYYEIHRRCLYFVAGSPYCVKQTNYKHCGKVSIISKRIFAAVCQCENILIRNYCINRIYHGI